jgi:hypothetical protein
MDVVMGLLAIAYPMMAWGQRLPGRRTMPHRIPRRPAPGGCYQVEPPSMKGEGRPVVLHFIDWNGDGMPLEFAFHVAEACSSVQMGVMGYRNTTTSYGCIRLNWSGRIQTN